VAVASAMKERYDSALRDELRKQFGYENVMQVPRLMAPGLTLGAALSNSTRERPCASLPVTTRRIGFIPSGMGVLLGSGFVYIAPPVRAKGETA